MKRGTCFLSPRVQASLASFFRDKASREKYFPHLQGIFVATHSHQFLDKSNISNNFMVRKSDKNVYVEQVSSISQLHELQFNMLGNSLESLFLPAAVIICEGKTDKPFISRIVQMRFPNRKILVIESQGDPKRVFRNFSQMVGNMENSPFRGRTFVVLDSVHTPRMKEELMAMGACVDNVIIWEKNGIEYVYPPSLLTAEFMCDVSDLAALRTAGDEVIVGTTHIRKVTLSERVVAGLLPDTEYSQELETKFLIPLAVAIGEAG